MESCIFMLPWSLQTMKQALTACLFGTQVLPWTVFNPRSGALENPALVEENRRLAFRTRWASVSPLPAPETAVRSWAHHSASLGLSFFICKTYSQITALPASRNGRELLRVGTLLLCSAPRVECSPAPAYRLSASSRLKNTS